ncbi:hypothetical protein HanPSC8_Chr06g0248621 [Helianthus annuus]|nr:hypothetical protein HanPSC8_Chr06g0248621 [Helianthus annuus]
MIKSNCSVEMLNLVLEEMIQRGRIIHSRKGLLLRFRRIYTTRSRRQLRSGSTWRGTEKTKIQSSG